MQTIATDDLARFIEILASRLAQEKDHLTELDAAIGDADHGINMERGFSAVVAKLPELRAGLPGALLKGVGMTLISTVGGAAGPLYGTFFLRAAAVLGNEAVGRPGALLRRHPGRRQRGGRAGEGGRGGQDDARRDAARGERDRAGRGERFLAGRARARRARRRGRP